jgi:hypothetical protein
VSFQRARKVNSIVQVRWPTLGLGASTCSYNDLLLGLNKVIGSANLVFLAVATVSHGYQVSNLRSTRLDGRVNNSAARSGPTSQILRRTAPLNCKARFLA